MSANIQKLVRVISEQIAKDMIVRLGTGKISASSIAFEVADVFEELNDLDVDDFYRLINAYIEVADVHVSIPTFRVKDDGTFKSNEQLSEEMGPY